MPEGHIVHADAARFTTTMAGQVVRATSPQGRFASGAALLDGRVLLSASAVGKHLFLRFADGPFLHVHLGLIGSWSWWTRLSTGARVQTAGPPVATSSTNVRLRLSVLSEAGAPPVGVPPVGAGVPSVGVGVPQAGVAPVGVGVSSAGAGVPSVGGGAPSAAAGPVGHGASRVGAGDLPVEVEVELRGVMTCDVVDELRVEQLVSALGPDPIRSPTPPPELWDRVHRSPKPVGTLLLDQSVAAGSGLIWRCEAPFLARVSPYLPGRDLTPDTWQLLWHSLSRIMTDAVPWGAQADAPAGDGHTTLADTFNVFRRHNHPCRQCHTPIQVAPLTTRKVWWCPHHQPAPSPSPPIG